MKMYHGAQILLQDQIHTLHHRCVVCVFAAGARETLQKDDAARNIVRCHVISCWKKLVHVIISDMLERLYILQAEVSLGNIRNPSHRESAAQKCTVSMCVCEWVKGTNCAARALKG